jgi:hypothetical protein
MAAAGFKGTAIILTFAHCNANYARYCAQKSSSLMPIPLTSVYVGAFNVQVAGNVNWPGARQVVACQWSAPYFIRPSVMQHRRLRKQSATAISLKVSAVCIPDKRHAYLHNDYKNITCTLQRRRNHLTFLCHSQWRNHLAWQRGNFGTPTDETRFLDCGLTFADVTPWIFVEIIN